MTASTREAIEIAFEGLGGAEALTTWAREHQTEFYTRILPKLLPMQVGAEPQSRVSFTIEGLYDGESVPEKTE